MADGLGVVPSGSLSLLSTVPVASDPEVAAIVSSTATGASLTDVMLRVSVAGALLAWPSFTVNVKLV